MAMVFGDVISPYPASPYVPKKDQTGVDISHIDLHVENTTYYPNWTPQWNSISGAFGEINIDGPGIGQPTQELGLKFKFVNRATNQPVEISWMQFSVFDFDQSANGNGKECVTAKDFVDYALSDGQGVVTSAEFGAPVDTEIEIVNINNGGAHDTDNDPDGVNPAAVNNGQFCSTKHGYGKDNPSDPLNLTKIQKSRAISFFYEKFSEFEITISIDCCIGQGRNFGFAGRAAQIQRCPAPPSQ
jgi:hypothetical protein